MVEQQESVSVTRRTVGRGTVVISASGLDRAAVAKAAREAWEASDPWLRSAAPRVDDSPFGGFSATFCVADSE